MTDKAQYDGQAWPKLHFCSFRARAALDEWESFQSWQRLNPEFELRFYDDRAMEEYVRQYVSVEEFAGFMALPKMAAKVDVWRLLILFNEGGLYTDLDVECLKPVKEWNGDPRTEVMLFVDSATSNGFGQHVLLAKPQNRIMHAALKLALERCLDPRYRRLSDFQRVVKTTGPSLFTDACFIEVLHRSRKNVDQVGHEEKVNVTRFREAGGPEIAVLRHQESEGILFRHAIAERQRIYAKYQVAHWIYGSGWRKVWISCRKLISKAIRFIGLR
ncbi:MAG: glycosyltransferase [Nitrosomonadales bacterium]